MKNKKEYGDYLQEHVKQPLFTTEDGVDIFEGDIYFLVTEKYNYGIAYTRNNSNYSKTLQNNNKRFSTKEAAEEYVLLNKPCLSLKEIKENTTIKGLSLKKLQKLVQQKLNK